MTSIIAAASSALFAAFLLFEAEPKRATLNWGQEQLVRRRALRLGGLTLMALSMWFMITFLGVHRGLPIWFGFITAFGLLGLMIANWRRQVHHGVGAFAAITLIGALIASGLGES